MKASHKIDVLENDGLFMVLDFLDQGFLSDLLSEISNAKQFFTPFLDFENQIEREEKIPGRPNAVFEISEPLHKKLENKILEIKPEIEESMSIELDDLQNLYYSVYQTGDFIGSHADASRHTNELDGVRTPRMVVIVFLNDHVDEQDNSLEGYSGGELTIYGLIKNRKLKGFGYPLKCKAGTLLAFPAHCKHEVTKVTRGTRYVANTRFF